MADSPSPYVSAPYPQKGNRNPGELSSLFKDFMSADATVERITRALMGNCEFRWDDDKQCYVLGETVTTTKGDKIFCVPPINQPLVTKPEVINFVRALCHAYINPDSMFANVPDPEFTATVIGVDVCNYIFQNYEKLGFSGRIQDAHLVRIIICDNIYHRLSGGRNNDFKEMLTKTRHEESTTADVTERRPDQNPLSGLLGRNRG